MNELDKTLVRLGLYIAQLENALAEGGKMYEEKSKEVDALNARILDQQTEIDKLKQERGASKKG